MSSTDNCEIEYSQAELAMFISRNIVIGLALLSVLFVLITCILSRRYQFWPFKLLIVQSISEVIDLTGALALSSKSICYPELCKYIGYIMHCAWLTSFSCSFMMMFLYYRTSKQTYNKHIANINLYISIFVVWPILWLLPVLLLEEFGPTGWHKFRDESSDVFYLFCGFKDNLIYYLIFWGIPLIFIFVSQLYFAYKTKTRIEVYENTGIKVEQLELIKNVTFFPKIYSFAWASNAFIKLCWVNNIFTDNEVIYFIYITIFLLFEIHLVIAAIYFTINYGPLIQIGNLWSCKFRKRLDNSTINQSSNLIDC
ncbi:hypothetical protein pb186bvf_011180 [Paramecium bursaria]